MMVAVLVIVGSFKWHWIWQFGVGDLFGRRMNVITLVATAVFFVGCSRCRLVVQLVGWWCRFIVSGWCSIVGSLYDVFVIEAAHTVTCARSCR